MQGAGTRSEPYLVYTEHDLKQVLSHGMFVHYKQMTDIDLGYQNWVALTGHNTFIHPDSNDWGSYDGNGKIISNLCISIPWGAKVSNAQGLFGSVIAFKIRNVTIKNCKVSTAFSSTANGSAAVNIGVIVSSITHHNSEISGCRVLGVDFELANSQRSTVFGGLAAYVRDTAITDCVVDGIKFSLFKVNETASTSFEPSEFAMGGLLGEVSNAIITKCSVANFTFASDVVFSYTSINRACIGGLVGYLRSSPLRISDSYVDKTRFSTTHYEVLPNGYPIGGLVGSRYSSDHLLTVTNCYFDVDFIKAPVPKLPLFYARVWKDENSLGLYLSPNILTEAAFLIDGVEGAKPYTLRGGGGRWLGLPDYSTSASAHLSIRRVASSGRYKLGRSVEWFQFPVETYPGDAELAAEFKNWEMLWEDTNDVALVNRIIGTMNKYGLLLLSAHKLGEPDESIPMGVVGASQWNGSNSVTSNLNVHNTYYLWKNYFRSTTGGGKPSSSAELKRMNNFVDWDFTSTWYIMEQQDYPRHRKWFIAKCKAVELPMTMHKIPVKL